MKEQTLFPPPFSSCRPTRAAPPWAAAGTAGTRTARRPQGVNPPFKSVVFSRGVEGFYALYVIAILCAEFYFFPQIASLISKRKLIQEGFLEALLAWSKKPTGCSNVLCLLNATALKKTGVSTARVIAHFVTGQTPEESSRNKLCPPPRRALLPPDVHVPFQGRTAGWHRRAARLALKRG